LVQAAVARLYGYSPSPAKIWKSIRHKDITRQIRSFLWRCMHGSLRIGKYWKHIPGFEERELCTTCQVPESLEHILLQCTRPGQAKIWSLAEELWTKRGHTWQLPTLGALLGSGLASFTVEGRKSPADDRLYKILITESTHLIWKLRCEFVVGREGTDPPSDHEVRNKWVFAMNERIEVDRNLTNTLKYGKQYSVAPSLILGTWRGVLKDKDQMPDDWLREPEVLVGIAADRSRRPPSPPVGRRSRNR
jgi:ribonuclease HI